MASRRAPGSILEAPGLDFGGSGSDLFEIFVRFGACCLEADPSSNPSSNSSSNPCQWTPRVAKNGQESPSAKNAKNAKNAKSQDSFP